jgi:hypothetical protein
MRRVSQLESVPICLFLNEGLQSRKVNMHGCETQGRENGCLRMSQHFSLKCLRILVLSFYAILCPRASMHAFPYVASVRMCEVLRRL